MRDEEEERKPAEQIEVHLTTGKVIVADLFRFQRTQYTIIINAEEGKYEIPGSALAYTFRPRRVT